MDITSQNFRDKRVAQIVFDYDLEHERHSLVLTVQSRDGDHETYILSGLREISLYEDFTSFTISHCTLKITQEEVYLSLDPYLGGMPSKAEDNMWFIAETITLQSS